ncbi:galactokinase [Neobacillus sp. PS3-34]|uniref:galactokinase n=1 Tax=Neobacillus sp. PS3-34 TaxID=3070678 RepID=UPI0027E18D61|nr:galactokinase [Neobacillus sp. PS3-34]WML48313.1 galactokinase [Neobacillus sp. PS3-34]
MREKLKKDFEEVFENSENVEFYFAPGRVNLIGEHTDYNGGHVFPCAISLGTYAAARKTNDNIIKLYSKNFHDFGVVEVSLDELDYDKKHDWANYPKGIIWTLKKAGHKFDSGFEVLFYGDLPNGAGLSSSASIEMVTAVLLKDLYNLNIDMLDMIKLSQATENNYIGVNCGIMDQFIIGMGKKNHAVLLDTTTLNFEYAEIKLDKASIVIANTNKRRGLSDSKYNERRRQCEDGLENIKRYIDVKSLGELNEETYEYIKDHITDVINRKRVKHAVYENRRTLKAIKALKNGEVDKFGRLMNESHISLRDDYEVTGVELDTLVELAWSKNGVIGSRMTGAGFGGCTLSIVDDDCIENFIHVVEKEYKEKIGYKPSFYVAKIVDGASKLTS